MNGWMVMVKYIQRATAVEDEKKAGKGIRVMLIDQLVRVSC